MRDAKETRLQMAVVDYLDGIRRIKNKVYPATIPFPDANYFHVPNQGRSRREGAKFKRMGVKPGVADLIFYWKGEKGAIELKTEDGILSPSQKKFKECWIAAKGRYAECRTVEEVRDTLLGWGLQCYNTVCIPPVPSKQELYKMAMDLWKK